MGIELGLRLDAAGDPDGTVRVVLSTPRAALRVPYLRGARLDAQGQLRADPNRPSVRFHLPSLRVQLLRPVDGAIDVELLSATAGAGTVADEIYDFIRMDPPHALIGPGDVVGFAFRAAILDLSGEAGPSGVPDGARTQPDAWQGLYLPEVRLFVAPDGLEGIAVSAGVRELWIGVGAHAGVTGEFNAEVVNRGTAPTVRLRFQTPSGAWIGVPDGDPIPDVLLPEESLLAVDAGGGIAPFRIAITVGGVETVADRVEVTVPDPGSVSIRVRVTDSGAHETIRSFVARRRPAAALPAPGDQPVSATTTSSSGYAIAVLSATSTAVTVGLSPAATGSVAWTWPGGSASGATAQIPVAAGAPLDVTATLTRTTALTTTIDAYTGFDRPTGPQVAAGPATPWHLDPANLRSAPWASRTAAGGAPPLLDAAGLARLAALPKDVAWTVEGFASSEGYTDDGHVAHNQALSERRRDALVAVLRTVDPVRYPELGFTSVTAGTAHGQTAAAASTSPVPGDPSWWRATATAHVDQTVTTTARLERPVAPPPVRDLDPTPTKPPVPACFRKIGVTVELLRGTFVRAEVYGEIDIRTATENRLAASGTDPLPAASNPNDGISRFLLRLRIAEDRSSWDVTGEFRAIEADTDGLWQTRRGTGGSQRGIDVLGAVAVFAPLMAAVTPASPSAGELVPMALVGGTAVAVGATGVMETRSVTLHGAQVVVTSGLVDPTSGDGPRSTAVSVLLDVETAFTFDIGIIRVEPTKPLTARYKAVGVRSQWRSDPQPDGTIQYVPLPVFDPAAGYSLDIPAGSLVGPGPLAELLRVLGGRISRDNPLYLEIEVGIGVDLGVVSIDTARVRVKLEDPVSVELTALGASIDVPGTLHGSGYVKILESGFEGAFDLTLTALNVRISAQLAVSTQDGVTGVLIGAEVQFPAPLPLGGSGLAIYGFLGGVAVNFARKPTGGTVPALTWLQQQLAPPRESIMHPAGWEMTPGSYAVAGGILLGTAEGGFILHLKGLVLVEVPGPRLLFAMKADVLSLPPVLKDHAQSATFLAVLDLDLGRGTITIAIVAAYEIERLLSIRVPVTAFFDKNDLDSWFVDLGTNTEPVTVSVLDVFEGTGYLMVHGDGTTISIPALPLETRGLTIAVGFHLRAVLMGSKSIGLYLEVAAGFDAIVSFSPFAIGGHIYVSGELRLWIIGISARADLTVLVGPQRVDVGLPTERVEDRTYVHGKVCGKVSFFFFDVEGCVELTIGDNDPAPLTPPPLVSGVSLVSRSPALVEGSAVDRAVDGVLATAVEVGDPGEVPSVPLDVVPVVLFDVAPQLAAGNVVLGGRPLASSGLPADPWVRRGDRWWRYRVDSVVLDGALLPSDGLTPATWWSRRLADDPQIGPALALLSWMPTPTPRAVPLGEQLTRDVERRWGTLCTPAAAPAPVLWTFDGQSTGPSSPGWRLTGTAWPDAADTQRSSPAERLATVTEPWRTGDQLADLLQGTSPAIVVGDQVPCGPTTRALVAARGAAAGLGSASLPTAGPGIEDAVALLADGATLDDLAAVWADSAWSTATPDRDDDQPTGKACEGRILRSPVDDRADVGGTDGAESELIKAVWSETGFRPAELADAVRVRCAGGFVELDVVLLVPRKGVERGLELHLRAVDGTVLDIRQVTGADLIGSSNPVPATWTDPSGPWAGPVTRSAALAGRIIALQSDLVPVLVHLTAPAGTVEVEIGWNRQAVHFHDRAFWVVAFAATTQAEVDREDWDTTVVTEGREDLEDLLAQDPDDHALLTPGGAYTVRVVWSAQSVQQESRPSGTVSEPWSAPVTQEFAFTADGIDEAPERLDPWLLTTAPAPGEVGVLTGEPLRLALSSTKVVDLFDAYGEELRVRVRSASGRHPSPPDGGPAGQAVTLPGVVDALVAGGAVPLLSPMPEDGLSVMTPWQDTVTALAEELPCVDASHSTTHHTVVTLAYGLEPMTDYLMDVIAVPRGAPRDAAGRRLYRVPFTTSRFAGAEDIAVLTRNDGARHALCPTPAALATLPERPTGAVLDEAFQAAGLPVPQVPRHPSVTVLWSPEAVPQPVAVVVEGNEQLWRSRPVPTEVTDPTDPSRRWWVARDADWLSLRPVAGAPPAGSPPSAPVTRIVQGPGRTRAVVLLGPAARGSELRLELVVAADVLSADAETTARAVQVLLDAAPWEVED
ncbi:hypothetical protein [Actinotalea sp.]|uniref:hypothetical protein n=1 Tax=Actinotalea sp. TaxID=1872145 RepID=UPI003561A04F